MKHTELLSKASADPTFPPLVPVTGGVIAEGTTDTNPAASFVIPKIVITPPSEDQRFTRPPSSHVASSSVAKSGVGVFVTANSTTHSSASATPSGPDTRFPSTNSSNPSTASSSSESVSVAQTNLRRSARQKSAKEAQGIPQPIPGPLQTAKTKAPPDNLHLQESGDRHQTLDSVQAAEPGFSRPDYLKKSRKAFEEYQEQLKDKFGALGESARLEAASRALGIPKSFLPVPSPSLILQQLPRERQIPFAETKSGFGSSAASTRDSRILSQIAEKNRAERAAPPVKTNPRSQHPASQPTETGLRRSSRLTTRAVALPAPQGPKKAAKPESDRRILDEPVNFTKEQQATIDGWRDCLARKMKIYRESPEYRAMMASKPEPPQMLTQLVRHRMTPDPLRRLSGKVDDLPLGPPLVLAPDSYVKTSTSYGNGVPSEFPSADSDCSICGIPLIGKTSSVSFRVLDCDEFC